MNSFQRDKNEVGIDTIAVLSFDFLKQLTTLSLAAAGGAITLTETVLKDSELRPLAIVGVALLFCAAIAALQVQQILVERLRKDTDKFEDVAFKRFKLPRTANSERMIAGISFGMFGGGLALVLLPLFR